MNPGSRDLALRNGWAKVIAECRAAVWRTESTQPAGGAKRYTWTNPTGLATDKSFFRAKYVVASWTEDTWPAGNWQMTTTTNTTKT